MEPFQSILYLDLEPLNNDAKTIREIGVVIGHYQYKSGSASQIFELIEPYQPQYLCGHNIRAFDYHYLMETRLSQLIQDLEVIDTLDLSLLFFNEKTLHKLPKAYKADDPERISDPLEDAKITRELLFKLVKRFSELSDELKIIYHTLLCKTNRFKAFFRLIESDLPDTVSDLNSLIVKVLNNKIRNSTKMDKLIEQDPVALAFILSVLHNDIEVRAFPPKVYFDYPHIQELLVSLTFDPEYEIKNLTESAKTYFGFDSFRAFPKLGAEKDLFAHGQTVSQKDIITDTLKREHLLTVLPTGGGKTFTFWLPAIIKAKKTKSLTVVISPLQALMKDHIFNFNKKLVGLSSAEALSGYLTLPQRRTIIRRIINGSVDILYLAPESLRSKNLERILKFRYIDRIVIDEAHCLSTWGNDFRHDYYYIASFIQKITDQKYNGTPIPLSCFTATANKKTIEDIEGYFKGTLGVTFKTYIASPNRTNLTYSAQRFKNKKEKAMALTAKVREIEDPILIYNPASRKQCEDIAEQLSTDLGRSILPFHAGLSSSVKNNTLTGFIKNEAAGIVATTAFGMGIDKPDIRHVMHYEISASLEDYMQESGRGGRDGGQAHCHLLFNSDDFDKLFFSQIRQKVTQPEIKKVFQVIKSYDGMKTKDDKKRIVVSIHELAQSIGIQTDDENAGFDTKIKTAILELERCGYLKRGYNIPDVWVTSLHFSSMEDVHEILKSNGLSETAEDENERIQVKSIVLVSKTLIKKSGQRFSLHIEDLAHLLNLDVNEIYRVLDQMRQMDLISLKEDLIIGGFRQRKLLQLVQIIPALKTKLLPILNQLSQTRFKLKDLNQRLNDEGISIQFSDYAYVLKYLLFSITRRGVIECYRRKANDQYWHLSLVDHKKAQTRLSDFLETLETTAKYLLQAYRDNKKDKLIIPYETMVHSCNNTLKRRIPVSGYDQAVMYLHNIFLIKLEGGRVLHHMRIEVLMNKDFDARKQYTLEDYKRRMAPMYQRKRASVHIINQYIDLLEASPDKAQAFAQDYFSMDYDEFIRANKLSRLVNLPVSQHRYKKIKKGLTEEQKEVVFDDKSRTMLILAGPGTGKTMVLINKIAHMILDENYKPEHFLMLTFTRSAAHEFKQRLFQLLGDLAYDIDIYTFHAYATELAGITIDRGHGVSVFEDLISRVTAQLHNDEIVLPFKNAIILDEFQDVNSDSFEFIKALYWQFSNRKDNERENDVRIIAVGDDDQCIMETTNGADINFMRRFISSFTDENQDTKKHYQLTTNFRSQASLVNYCNQFAQNIKDRIHIGKQLIPKSTHEGDVRVFNYSSTEFLFEIKDHILKSDSSQIAVLTHENEQVLDLYSILKQHNMDVMYLLRNEGFKLYMLDEIFSFTAYLKSNLEDEANLISHKLFEDAKNFLKATYTSSTLPLALNHINAFEDDHELLTLSFWENYTFEVNVSDVQNTETKVIVSTIHKSKGKEFDEVHVVLQKKHSMNLPDYFYRLYYVALSRAKSKLLVHTFPNDVFTKGESRIPNPAPPKQRILIMQLEDCYLSYLAKNKSAKDYVARNKIQAGDSVDLIPSPHGFDIVYGKRTIGKTSKAFTRKLNRSLKKGYSPSEVQIEYIAKWHSQDTQEHLNIFLCRVILKIV
ncbi:MAG: RecQ family ATP-dependent DNA helicase [Desulfobacter sp.]|nr:MAG: RecQ family ATP-dependent DNA helicase [Desulfobacter sp.]